MALKEENSIDKITSLHAIAMMTKKRFTILIMTNEYLPILSQSLAESISWSTDPIVSSSMTSFREQTVWPHILQEVKCNAAQSIPIFMFILSFNDVLSMLVFMADMIHCNA